MPFSIEVRGAREIKAKFDGEFHRGPLRRALEDSLQEIETRAKFLVPVDTGRLRGSITHRLERAPIGNRWGWVGSNLPYATAVHEGRRAGGRMPPVSAIRAWLVRKGRDPRLAFVVARSIGRRGIRGRPFLRKALDQTRGKINRHLERAAREIERAWSS